MAIRAAFFDVGNVLLRFSHRRVLRKFAWAVGRHPVNVARHIWKHKVVERIESGQVGGEEIYSLFRADLGYRGTYAQFRLLWCDHFTLDRGSHALLKRVSRRVPTYLLSNTNALHFDFIRARYAFPRQVRGAILSHEVGLRKPDLAIYRAALKLSKTRPEETLFVDDLAENVAAAAAAGLVAVQFKGAPALKRRLAALDLL